MPYDVAPRRALMLVELLMCAFARLVFADSIQFAIGTPLFSQKLKVSDSNIAIILSTAGPISGFIVQPVIGVLSDRFRPPRVSLSFI